MNFIPGEAFRGISPQILAPDADKSYVRQDRLLSNAQDLLDQALTMGPSPEVTVLELPAGGYYFLTGAGHDLTALRSEHGARFGWQVRTDASGILVDAQSGDRSCRLKREKPGQAITGALRDAPAYLLV